MFAGRVLFWVERVPRVIIPYSGKQFETSKGKKTIGYLRFNQKLAVLQIYKSHFQEILSHAGSPREQICKMRSLY